MLQKEEDWNQKFMFSKYVLILLWRRREETKVSQTEV